MLLLFLCAVCCGRPVWNSSTGTFFRYFFSSLPLFLSSSPSDCVVNCVIQTKAMSKRPRDDATSTENKTGEVRKAGGGGKGASAEEMKKFYTRGSSNILKDCVHYVAAPKGEGGRDWRELFAHWVNLVFFDQVRKCRSQTRISKHQTSLQRSGNFSWTIFRRKPSNVLRKGFPPFFFYSSIGHLVSRLCAVFKGVRPGRRPHFGRQNGGRGVCNCTGFQREK